MIFMRKCTKMGPPQNLSFSDGDTCGVPWEPKATKMEPKATKIEPKGAQSYQNGAQGCQNDPKIELSGSKTVSKMCATIGTATTILIASF